MEINAATPTSPKTPVSRYSKKDNVKAIEIALENLAKNQKEPKTNSHKIARQMICDILELGWNPNTPLSKGSYLIHNLSSHLDLFKLALEKGADPELTDANGRNAFFYHSEVDNVNALIARLKDYSALKIKDHEGISAPLFLAMNAVSDSNEFLEAITILLEYGAEFKCVFGAKNRTILHEVAALKQLPNLYDYFLKLDLDVNVADLDKRTALDMAIEYANYQLILKLLENGAHFTEERFKKCIDLLHNCSNQPDREDTNNQRIFAEHIIDHPLLSKIGWSKLHFAAYVGQSEWIEKYSKEMPEFLNKSLPCTCNRTELANTPLSLLSENPLNLFLLFQAGAKYDEELLQKFRGIEKKLFLLYKTPLLPQELLEKIDIAISEEVNKLEKMDKTNKIICEICLEKATILKKLRTASKEKLEINKI